MFLFARRAGFLLCLCLALASPRAEARWSDEYAPVQNIFVDDGIACLTSFRGQPIVAGCFGEIGGRRLDHIGAWDGKEWRALGEGLSSVVYDAVEWDGRLIVAGDQFRSRAGLIGGVAAWDGRSWKQLGTGNPGAARLVVWHDRLVSMGPWCSPGRDIEVLEGKRWVPLQGLPPEAPVTTIGVWGADLLAGTWKYGVFRRAGQGWEALGPDSAGMVVSFCATRDGLAVQFVKGASSDSPTASVKLLAAAGGRWRDLEAGTSLRPRLLGTWQGRALVSRSRTSLAVWSPTGWDSIPLPWSGDPVTSLDGDGRLWVLLGRDLPGSESVHQLIMWDGRSWTLPPAGSGPDGEVRTLLSQGNRLIAGGSFSRFGARAAWRTAVRDGSGWAPLVPAPETAPFCRADDVDALEFAGGSVVAGGEFHCWPESRRARAERHILARLEGSAWRPFGGNAARCWLDSGVSQGQATACSIAEGPGGLVVAGDFCEVGQIRTDGIGLWDGSRWRALGEAPGTEPGRAEAMSLPIPGFSKVVPFRSGVVAAGRLRSPGGPRFIGSWKDGAWDFMDQGTNGQVMDLLVDGDRLIAAGSFSRAGEAEAGNIAAWDGTRWLPVGEGLPEPVTALGSYHGRPIAATRADVRPAGSRLWSWTGGNWEPFEGGTLFDELGSEVHVIVEHEDDLYVGGSFAFVNGLPSANLARWIGEDSGSR